MSTAPNILFIICDDLGWGDLSAHGNTFLKTRCLDDMRKKSTCLTRYCSGPLCTPARASVMTGRYHLRTNAVDTYLGRSIMHPDEVTLAELFKDGGYSTGIFGKWHLGDHYPTRPQDKGFERAVTHGGGGIGQYGDLPENRYSDPTLSYNGEQRQTSGYCTDIFFKEAKEFILENKTKPFFVYLAPNCPHTPLQVPEEWTTHLREKGCNDELARLYAMIENIDENVGSLLEFLEAHHLLDDTLVVFTSDHGIQGKRYNGGLRGRKGTLYEGGIRVPCFIHYPKKFPQDLDVDRLTSPIDWLPTLCKLANVSVPDDLELDGIDLLPLLSGEIEKADWPDRELFMQWHRGDTPEPFRNAALITQSMKYYSKNEEGPIEVYNIENDPGEEKDLASTEESAIEAFQEKYRQWFDSIASTRGEETFAPIHLLLDFEQQSPICLTRQDWRLYGEEEGWTSRHPGYWLVESPVNQTVSFDVYSPDDLAEVKQLVVQWGTQKHCIPVNGSLQDIYHFSDFKIETGKSKLEAYFESENGERLGTLRLELKKQ